MVTNQKKLKIPFIDLCSSEKKKVFPSIVAEIEGLFKCSQYILGEEVAAFEKEFSKLCHCSHGIGVNSGLDALILALRALNIGPGDEVITVPNSYIATAAAISLVGAKPVFVDVGWDQNLDPALLEDVITQKTKAVIPVHLTGNPCRMDEILEVAKKHALFVIEDAAQAVGATYKGRAVGGMGNVGCFSLHPLKNLHVWGDGGMITTNSQELAGKLGLQRNHGHRNRDEVEFFSYNSRLDTLHAIVGKHYLKLLGSTIEKRKKHAELYDKRLTPLGDLVTTPIVDWQNVNPVFHLYVICAKDRDKLMEHLLEKGIETKIHYPIPIHLQKAASYLGYRKGNFPVTESLSSRMLSLPIRENLAEDEVHEVCDVIEAFYMRGARTSSFNPPMRGSQF